jgi:hypothetical protein
MTGGEVCNIVEHKYLEVQSYIEIWPSGILMILSVLQPTHQYTSHIN